MDRTRIIEKDFGLSREEFFEYRKQIREQKGCTEEELIKEVLVMIKDGKIKCNNINKSKDATCLRLIDYYERKSSDG